MTAYVRTLALVLFAVVVFAFVLYVWGTGEPGISGPEPPWPTTVPVSPGPAAGS